MVAVLGNINRYQHKISEAVCDIFIKIYVSALFLYYLYFMFTYLLRILIKTSSSKLGLISPDIWYRFLSQNQIFKRKVSVKQKQYLKNWYTYNVKNLSICWDSPLLDSAWNIAALNGNFMSKLSK